MTVPTVVVVPTKNRPRYLADCVRSLDGQAHSIMIVDNGSRPRLLPFPDMLSDLWIIPHDEYPPNISRLWNLGIDQAARVAEVRGWDVWNVLVVNDDIVAPLELVDTLSAAMRATSAVCAYPDQFDVGRRILHTEAHPVLTAERICGYCFMLRGEASVRADEDFVWWFGDDTIDWVSRQRGGSLLVPGVKVEHRAPDIQTRADPVLSEQTNADHKTWIAKWGCERPVLM
jgi:glycosyltransferase involved in cell wall biosynthesis